VHRAGTARASSGVRRINMIMSNYANPSARRALSPERSYSAFPPLRHLASTLSQSVMVRRCGASPARLNSDG
jgi:hypothetical protein